MGPQRQSVECERVDAPIDQIDVALQAGGLVLALIGLAGQPRATWRAVQVLSANGTDGQMMVREMFNDTAYQLPDPKRSVVGVVIFPQMGSPVL